MNTKKFFLIIYRKDGTEYKRLTLDKHSFTIGSSRSCDIVITKSSIPATHSEIVIETQNQQKQV